jgi:two-component system, cell cycle sensor histidine kinase and response regulator CckA
MTKQIAILILEDRSADAELMMLELQREGIEFTAKRVWTETDFCDELREHAPDLILADYSLPSYDGLSALKLTLKERPGTPFILVSGGLGEEIAIEALHHGATDYVLKQRLARIGPAVRRALREMELATERKQADEELRKLLFAVEQCPVTIVITDVEGTIEYVNPKFTELTGYTKKEVIGLNTRVIKSGKTSREFYVNLWQTIKAGKVWRGVFQNKKKNGELFSERATISPVMDEAGNITRFIAIKEDITDRLKLEEQLRQSQKMDAIGHLAAGVAHDFNNLLTIVQFEASLMAMNPSLDTVSRDGVSQIEKAAERAANLTRQLLAFSRKQQKEVRLIDLPGLVADMTRLLQRILGEDITLTTQIASGLPPLLADPGMIEQVIMNLAVNSRDAMSAGGKLDITVSEIAFDDATSHQHPGGRPGNFFKLEVRDTGSGIAPEHLSQIYEPFFTTKDEGKGTGLGLATVFGIVKLHNGWIEVASELGQGTVFQVFLPIAPTSEVEQLAATPPAKLKGGTETILVTEDEEPIRRLMQIALERYGYRVLIAENGADAVKTLGENGTKVDLLITDLVMPGGMNGRELAQKLHAMFADLKVIYVSGFTSDNISRDLNLEPGVNFLRKPFSIYALAELVRHRLDVVEATSTQA